MRELERPRHPRGYPIHRPYWGECPEDLLGIDIHNEFELDWVRVAKHGEHVIAAYYVKPLVEFEYQLAALAVIPNYRREGIGRWMLLHAIGVIETKGGRIVHADFGRRIRMLERVGFERAGNYRYKLLLVPE